MKSRQILQVALGVLTSIGGFLDVGAIATAADAGASFRFGLLWVVLAANLIAMLFQALSAKLGIVTGRSLAQLCREHLPRRVVLAMWGVSEVAAMATDLAEFLGGGIGLSLLLHIPLLLGLGITGLATYAMLMLGNRGFRPLELVIGGFVGIVSVSYVVELFVALDEPPFTPLPNEKPCRLLWLAQTVVKSRRVPVRLASPFVVWP